MTQGIFAPSLIISFAGFIRLCHYSRLNDPHNLYYCRLLYTLAIGMSSPLVILLNVGNTSYDFLSHLRMVSKCHCVRTQKIDLRQQNAPKRRKIARFWCANQKTVLPLHRQKRQDTTRIGKGIRGKKDCKGNVRWSVRIVREEKLIKSLITTQTFNNNTN